MSEGHDNTESRAAQYEGGSGVEPHNKSLKGAQFSLAALTGGRHCTQEQWNAFSSQIITSVKQGIIVVDRNLRYRLWNPVMEDMSGLRSDHMFGKHPDEVLPFVREQGQIEMIEHALEGKSSTTSDFPYDIPATGNRGWYTQSVDPLRDERGEIVGAIVVVQDVTQRKVAEQALAESEKRYHALFQTAPDAIALVDCDFNVVSVNQCALEMYGYESADEVIGKKASAFMTEDSYDKAAAQAAILTSTGGHVTFEATGVRKDGRQFPIETSTSLIFDDDGSPKALVHICRDISERVAATQALRHSEDQVRQLLDSVRDVIYTIAEDGTITSLNPVFEAITGWPVEAWIGKHFLPLVHPDDAEFASQVARQVLSGEAPPVYELRVRCKSGGHVVGEFKSTPRYEGGKVVGALGVVRNVTERKQAAESLARTQERFRMIAFECSHRVVHAG